MPDTMPDTTPITTVICGSTRFSTAHELAMMHLTLRGRIIIPCGLMGHHDSPPGARWFCDDGNEGNEVKKDLDHLHIEKIDAADGIFVVNVGGYVGSSTRREIMHAKKSGKSVEWMFPDAVPPEFKTEEGTDTLNITFGGGGYARKTLTSKNFLPVDIDPHAEVLVRAYNIYCQRNHKYKDLWKTYGWRGCLMHLRTSVERSWRLLWNYDKKPVHPPNVDDLLDTINYAVFAIRNIEGGNRDGDWEYK